MDFESTKLDKDTCEVWQIGAKAIRPRDLEIYDTYFNIVMRVDNPEEADPKSLAISNMTIDQIMDEGEDPKEAWMKFAEWCSQFNLGGKPDLFNAPVMAGHNIINFDRPIYERYCHKYKTLKKDKKLDKMLPGIFNPMKHYDLLQLMAYWTENLKEPKSLSLLNLRKYMGMPQASADKAHDALQDANDTALILQRVLRVARTVSHRIKFKNAFDPEAQARDKVAAAALDEESSPSPKKTRIPRG